MTETQSHSTFYFLLILLLISILSTFSAHAETIDTSHSYSKTIGTDVVYFQEQDEALSINQSLQAFNNGRFIKSERAVLNFGIAANPVWIAINVHNASTSLTRKQLTFKTSWLDEIEVYFINNNKITDQAVMGDIYPFSERPITDRFFSVAHDYVVGDTTIIARIASPDPLVIPLYFSSPEQFQTKNIKQSYYYGLVYGALLSLLAYNLVLYFSLGLKRYLFYSIHLGIFLITNLAYTGHGFQWVWSNSPLWQQWGNPILIQLFGTGGLVFSLEFLNTKHLFPRLHKSVLIIIGLFFSILLLAIILNSQSWALISSFSFISLYALIMIIMGLVSLHSGNKAAHFFLLASVTAAIGASISSAAVLGFIPFTDLTYHFAEIGMIFDAIFLALALAHLFRESEAKKNEAEAMARIDPLTSLNNRRAFSEYSEVIWNNALRTRNDISIIMLDIDKFKKINDTYGHNGGDEILVQLSAHLKSNNRTGDIIARWGGEEFIILLPDTSEQDAIAIAKRFHQDIATIPMNIVHEKISISCSFGVASKSNGNDSIDELISQSDKYLYLAKLSGRNRVCSRRDVNQSLTFNNVAIDSQNNSVLS